MNLRTIITRTLHTKTNIQFLKPKNHQFFKVRFIQIRTIPCLNQEAAKQNDLVSKIVKKEPTTSTSATSIFSKQRPIKKKTKTPQSSSSIPSFKAKAYATADYYDLDLLKESLLNSGAYEVIDIGKGVDNCLCVKPKYQQVNEIEPRHIFFFEDGSVVFWNVSMEEQNSMLEIIEKHEENPYPLDFVNEESEVIRYSRMKHLTVDLNKENDSNQDSNLINLIKFNDSHLDSTNTSFINNQIFFSEEKNHLLEKYAFSDAIALSVKLGIWEKNLDQFTEKIEFISQDLRYGKHLKLKSEEVLKYLGELFTMRHVVNLHSNFLDTPDFYWDRENLEQLYSQLYSYLSISKRTRLFNERLNHCIDLMEIIKQHLSDNKHTRLEWIIIGLITIEVLTALGVLDFFKSLAVSCFDMIKSNTPK